MRRPPVWIAAVLVLLIVASGWTVAQQIGSSPYATVTATIKTRLPGETQTRTIRRVTRGRIITLPSGTKVVHVPLIIIHTDHKIIRVPAHNLPFKRKGPATGGLTAAVAQPVVPVTVTVYVPAEPVTIFQTVTETTTVTDIVPTTVTVPLEPTTAQ